MIQTLNPTIGKSQSSSLHSKTSMNIQFHNHQNMFTKLCSLLKLKNYQAEASILKLKQFSDRKVLDLIHVYVFGARCVYVYTRLYKVSIKVNRTD